jgi:hypothetical protein
VSTAIDATTEALERPELAVNVLPDGVAPVAADVEEVTEVVTSSTEIV